MSLQVRGLELTTAPIMSLPKLILAPPAMAHLMWSDAPIIEAVAFILRSSIIMLNVALMNTEASSLS